MAWGRSGDGLSTARGRRPAAGEPPAAWGRGGMVFPPRSGTAAAAARWAITSPSTSPQALLLFQGSLSLQTNNTKTLGKGREVDCLEVHDWARQLRRRGGLGQQDG